MSDPDIIQQAAALLRDAPSDSVLQPLRNLATELFTMATLMCENKCGHVCSFMTFSPTNYREHLNEHCPNRPVACDDCLTEMKQHQLVHHQTNMCHGIRDICSECGLEDTRRAIEDHHGVDHKCWRARIKVLVNASGPPSKRRKKQSAGEELSSTQQDAYALLLQLIADAPTGKFVAFGHWMNSAREKAWGKEMTVVERRQFLISLIQQLKTRGSIHELPREEEEKEEGQLYFTKFQLSCGTKTEKYILYRKE